MNLKATVDGGTKGTIDLGVVDPTAVLPLTYDVIFTPHDDLTTIIAKVDDLPSFFTNPEFGTFEVVPEPSTLLLLGFGLAGMIGFGIRRKRLSKKA